MQHLRMVAEPTLADMGVHCTCNICNEIFMQSVIFYYRDVFIAKLSFCVCI